MMAQFDRYDFVAHLIPGLVFLWCVQMLADLFGLALPLSFTGSLTETSILIALGYITGLLLQDVSQGVVEKHVLQRLWHGFPSDRFLLPDDPHFSADYKARLLPLIEARFGVSAELDTIKDLPLDEVRKLRLKKNRELFYLIYNAVGETSQRSLTFLAHYGLFRVLLTMFGFLSLVSLAGFAWALCNRPDVRLAFGVWSAVFVGATFIAYFRCKKRGEDFARSVYDRFMATGGSKTASS